MADPATRIKEAPGATSTREEDYRADYVSQYSAEQVNPIAYDDARRNYEEALSECLPGSSLFIFGGGSSVHPNFYKRQGRFSKVISTDIVEQARKGLDPDVEFRIFNVLTDEFPETDYIFSSHTVEHFTRDEIMGTILPKCLAAAKQAVIFLVPWKDLGWGSAKAEGPHIVELCEDDELAAYASKWKRVRDNPTVDCPDQYGLELILWFEGQSNVATTK
jgi:hypothetical protein